MLPNCSVQGVRSKNKKVVLSLNSGDEVSLIRWKFLKT